MALVSVTSISPLLRNEFIKISLPMIRTSCSYVIACIFITGLFDSTRSIHFRVTRLKQTCVTLTHYVENRALLGNFLRPVTDVTVVESQVSYRMTYQLLEILCYMKGSIDFMENVRIPSLVTLENSSHFLLLYLCRKQKHQ